MLLITWLLSQLTSALGTLGTRTLFVFIILFFLNFIAIYFQQKSIAITEVGLLLHFPFIYSLANPCDFQTDMVDSSEEHDTSLVSLRGLIRNGEIPLMTQEDLDSLSPLRHLIDVQSNFCYLFYSPSVSILFFQIPFFK